MAPSRVEGRALYGLLLRPSASS